MMDGTGYAIGAAMAVHCTVLETAGLLDERYFLYFEDADYSVRARRGGYPVHVMDVPAALHGVSVSTRKLGDPLLLRYHARNALLFNATHAPLWARITLPFASLFGILTQAAKLLLVPSRRAASRGIALGIVDFYAKRFGHIAQDRRHRV
jgi:GT2 family glycosyltransferase